MASSLNQLRKVLAAALVNEGFQGIPFRRGKPRVETTEAAAAGLHAQR